MDEQTGAARVRSHKSWGKEYLVLQLEFEMLVTSCINGVVQTDRVKFWRDARTEDMNIVKFTRAGAQS